MALTQYLNLDYDQIKASIKDYIRSNNNFRDFDYEGSNLSILIDILAYNTYINSYNANMIANEAFLDTSSLRENVVSLVQNIGYTPRSARSARARISFTVSLPANTTVSSVKLEKGLVCVGNLDDTRYTFSTIEDISTPVRNSVAIFDDVYIFEGNQIQKTFTVNSALTDQKFILPNASIDTTSIKVRVKESSSSSIYEEYNLVESIIGLNSDDKIYLIKEYSDEQYELIFGDGIIGKKLSNGNVIEVDYIVCNSENGNNISNFSLVGNILDNSNNRISLTSIVPTTIEKSSGGSKIENIKSIKKYATKYYESQNRAVTSKDFESLVPRIFSKANSVVAFGGETLNPPQYGKVFLSVKPDNATFLSLYDKEFLRTELRKYATVGLDVEILDLKYLYVELDINAYYSPNLTSSSDLVKTKIISSIKQYAESEELNKFGSRFKYSNISKIIDESDRAITSNVTNVVLRRNIQPIFNSQYSYECCFGNKIFAPKCSTYNVRTTGFNVFEYDDTVYISDTSIDSKTGTLFLFRLDSSKNPVVLKSNIGTVDYESGELFIDSLNITNTSLSTNIVEVEVNPSSFDIIGLRDLFLNMSLNNLQVNMIEDNISAGSDTSGVEFNFTPNYKNKGYIRS